MRPSELRFRHPRTSVRKAPPFGPATALRTPHPQVHAVPLLPLELSRGTGLRKIGNKIAEPYQERIATAIARALFLGRSGAIMAPTGSGKSLNVHTTVEDAIAAGRPVIVLQPSIDLLRQNLAQLMESPALRNLPISVFVGAKEPFPTIRKLARNSFAAPIILATNMSFVRRRLAGTFTKGLQAFGAQKGVIIIDEGQTAGAAELSAVLERAASYGASGILLSATPFRPDAYDPLRPFRASLQSSLLEVAEYDEVLASGRIVPTRFDLAYAEFEANLTAEDIEIIEAIFDETLNESGSIDAASQESFARLFRPDLVANHPHAVARLNAAIGKIWLKRAATHELALVHCDSIVFARSLAQHLASLRMPDGHRHAGKKPIIGYISGEEALVWKDGMLLDRVEDLGWQKMSARTNLLQAARHGQVDAIVNIAALGVGVDIPRADLSILASVRRTASPTKQICGRTERACPETGKTHHTFVDIGRSIATLYSEVAAALSSNQNVSRAMQKLPTRVIEQFAQWFASDPNLGGEATKQLEIIESRARDVFCPLEAAIDVARKIPAFTPLAPGVDIRPVVGGYDLIYDFRETGLLDPAFGDLSTFARVHIEHRKISVDLFATYQDAACADVQLPRGRHGLPAPSGPFTPTPWLDKTYETSPALAALEKFRPDAGVAIARELAFKVAGAISKFNVYDLSTSIVIDSPATISPTRLAFVYAYARLCQPGFTPKLRCSAPNCLSEEVRAAFATISPIVKSSAADARLEDVMTVSSQLPGSKKIGMSREEFLATSRDKTFAEALDTAIKMSRRPSSMIILPLDASEVIEARNGLLIDPTLAKRPKPALVAMLKDAYVVDPQDLVALPALLDQAMRLRRPIEVRLDIERIKSIFSESGMARQDQIATKLRAFVKGVGR